MVSDLTAPDKLPSSTRDSHGVIQMNDHPGWSALSRIPETVTALIPLRKFSVNALMALGVGQIVDSNLPINSDIPMKIGQVGLAWGEFEVVESTMALRLTKVA